MLKNKIAFVNGAARGMGKAICLTMAGYGADIIAADINDTGAVATAEEVKKLGRRAIALKADVSDKASVDEAVDTAIREFGRIDILSNNAGICIPALLTEVSEMDWDKSMAVNAKGPLFMIQSVAKHMIKNNYGRIIVTASQSGKKGEYANGPYCVSKATVAMLVQVLALELSKYNIIVNSISPGYTNTELFKNGMADRAVKESVSAKKLIDDLMVNVPMGRAAEPQEIAELVAFLASEKNTYLTGTDILITGGNVMY